MLSKKEHTLDIPIKQEDYDALVKSGVCWFNPDKQIQDALGYLTASEREFIMTGVTDEEWNDTFGEPQ